jgi:hypothetical protein
MNMTNDTDRSIASLNGFMRRALFCTVVRNGGKAQFDFLKDRYNSSSDVALRDDLLSGLACSKESWLLEQLLEDESVFKLAAIRNMAIRSFGSMFAWNYVKRNWDQLYQQ